MFEAALAPGTAEVLRELNGELARNGWYLAGGTGLALQLGHRVSGDLDFFRDRDFDPAELGRTLSGRAGYEETYTAPGTLYCRLGGVKLSFIHYSVPLALPALEFAGVRVADWRDILAEKFKTVSQRGARRDFIDIHACFALKGLTVADGVGLFKTRFRDSGVNLEHVLRSLEWFEDADAEPEPEMLRPVDWAAVKRFFLHNHAEFRRAMLD